MLHDIRERHYMTLERRYMPQPACNLAFPIWPDMCFTNKRKTWSVIKIHLMVGVWNRDLSHEAPCETNMTCPYRHVASLSPSWKKPYMPVWACNVLFPPWPYMPVPAFLSVYFIAYFILLEYACISLHMTFRWRIWEGLFCIQVILIHI